MLIAAKRLLKGKLEGFEVHRYTGWYALRLPVWPLWSRFRMPWRSNARTRQEQRDLFETTLKEIQSEARTRPGSAERNRPQS